MSKLNQIAYSLSKGANGQSLTVWVGAEQYSADSTHPNWKAILQAINDNDSDGVVEAIDLKTAFEDYVEGNVRIVGGEVWHNETRLGGVVVDRILDFMGNGEPVRPILRFIDKLFSNPSSRAVNELYKFLEHEHLPITSEGNFQAYKGLNDDFYSVTAGNLTLLQGKANKSGHIYNGVGETIECVRHQVNDDKDQTCSYGLHAGSLEYATGFAQGKLVVVEIDPKDVVSIPSDYNGQKLRTCKYKVVREYTEPLSSVYVRTTSETFNGNDVEEDGTNEGCCGGSCGCEGDYDEGYDEGYTDGYDGNSRQLIADLSDEYQEGYNDGYRSGTNDSL